MTDRLPSNSKRGDRIGLVAVIFVGAIFMVLRFGEFPVGAGMDDAYYIEMARSLAEGRGPVIHLNEVVPGWNPGLFPFGFPLLLSPLAGWTAAPPALFKLVPMLAMAALVPLCLLLARVLPVGSRLALTALVCLNPWSIAYSVRVFSDLPFTAVSLGAVILFLGLADESTLRKPRFIVLILVTAAAIMIRTIGLALPVAMIATWLWHRRWERAFLLGTGVAVALLPQSVINRGTGGGFITTGYYQQLFAGDGQISSRITLMAENLVGYLKELPVVLVPVFGNPLQNLAARWGLAEAVGVMQWAVGFGLIGAVVWGLISLARTHRFASSFLTLYLLVYGGVLLNFSGYPSGVQARLLLPVVPLLLPLLLLVAGRADGAGRRQFFRPAVALLLFLAVAHNGYRAARPLNATPDGAGQVLIDPGRGAAWIQDHTGPDDLIMVRWPLRQHIHFARPVTGLGAAQERDLDLRLERFGVTHIVLGPGEPDDAMVRLRSLLEAVPARFPSVHQDDYSNLEVFRVVQDP
jgi:hypothetical protein